MDDQAFWAHLDEASFDEGRDEVVGVVAARRDVVYWGDLDTHGVDR